MRKLCTDEAGGQNEQKMQKKRILQFEQTAYFLYCSLALHFKDDL
jgi:hypothetical protein